MLASDEKAAESALAWGPWPKGRRVVVMPVIVRSAHRLVPRGAFAALGLTLTLP